MPRQFGPSTKDSPVKHGKLRAILPIVVTAALHSNANAQSPVQTQAQARSQNQDHVVLGAGVVVAPTYQGSSNTRVLPIPAIDIRQDWFTASLRNGVGIVPFAGQNFEMGVSAVFVQGYRQKDVPRGIDKLKGALGARIFANARAAGFVATAGVVKVATGAQKGVLADVTLSYPVPVSSRFTLAPSISATWASRKYNDGYFGISEPEALASGLSRFSARSGFKDSSTMLTATYRLSDRLTLSATGGVTALIGDAKNSPLVDNPTQVSGVLAITYRL
jgi:outer membrane protein